tara:strand:+ start:140 stop:601 length:462 start_codon:yes stop_codon:yes gene_type:complete
MNLEQVKEHFKNAKQVRCLTDGLIYNIDVHGCFDYGHSYKSLIFSPKYSIKYVYLFKDDKFAQIISYKNTLKNKYPKVLLVSMNKKEWNKRVVFMEKDNKFVAWRGAKTLEQAKCQTASLGWKYAKELPKEIEVTKEEIAKWKGCDVEQLIIK